MCLLVIVTAAMAFGFVFAGISYEKWSSDAPVEFKYFFYTVALLSVIATYRLLSWRRLIFFKANSLGMLFPCPKLKQCDSEYLFVPWKNINHIEMGAFPSTVSGNAKGVAINIKISLDERKQYFPELLLRDSTEWTTVGFMSAFLNKKKAISQLNQMKSQYT